MSTLKPCPFCGAAEPMVFPPTAKASDPYSPSDRLYPIVRCRTCSVEVCGANGDYLCKTAIEKWNVRVAAQPAPVAAQTEDEAVKLFINKVEKIAMSMKAPNIYTPQLIEACVAMNAALTAQPTASAEPLTDTYVQTVPDKCDRIVWRGSYYHLPLQAVAQEPVACFKCGHAKHEGECVNVAPQPAEKHNRRPYNASASLSEYGIFPECDAARQQPAVDGCHCATCTCNPNVTPAVRFDLSPARMEGAIREHLIRLGWTPPNEHAQQQPAPDVYGLAARLVDELDDLVSESGGVSGLHLNGDVATWEELLPGGRFERLSSLDELREALAAMQRTSDGGAA